MLVNCFRKIAVLFPVENSSVFVPDLEVVSNKVWKWSESNEIILEIRTHRTPQGETISKVCPRSFRTWNWKPESDRATVFPSVRPNCISLSAKRWRFWSNCCSAHFSRFLHGHGNENANGKNKGSELKAGKARRKNRNRNRTRNRKRAAVQRSNFANCLGKWRKCFSSSRPHTPQAGWHKRWEMPAAVFGLIMKSPQPHPRSPKKKRLGRDSEGWELGNASHLPGCFTLFSGGQQLNCLLSVTVRTKSVRTAQSPSCSWMSCILTRATCHLPAPVLPLGQFDKVVRPGHYCCTALHWSPINKSTFD